MEEEEIEEGSSKIRADCMIWNSSWNELILESEEEEEEPEPAHAHKGAKKIKGPAGPKGKGGAEGNPAECQQQ